MPDEPIIASDLTVDVRSAQSKRECVREGTTVLIMAIVSGLAAMVLLQAGARWWMPAAIAGPVGDSGWTSRTRAWFTAQGFWPAEYDPERDRSFNWTGPTAQILSPTLNRSETYRLFVLTSAARPNGPPFPLLDVAVDGQKLVTFQTSNELSQIGIEIPRRQSPGTLVTLNATNTFVPGPQDRRELGVILFDTMLMPIGGHFRPSWSVTALAGLAITIGVAGLLLGGLRGPLAIAASAAAAVWMTCLLLQDGAFMGGYVERVVAIGIAVGVGGAALACGRRWWPPRGELSEWPTAAALTLEACALKLALFAHPFAIVGDGIFQIHRAMLVRAGTYFFTSVTPRPFFEFPYPIALYVAAQPFWRFFRSDLGFIWLLRAVTLCADAWVGIFIWAAARRHWKDRRTALICVVLWALARAPLQAVSNANLTNAFGQAVFGMAMGVMAWAAAGSRISPKGLALGGGLLTVAFLSHFSTVSLGVPILAATGAAVIAAGRHADRRFGVWVLIAAVLAASVSYGVYYSHFRRVYARTFTRVVSIDLGTERPSKVVASPARKFRSWISGRTDDYGLPGVASLVAAASGLFLLLKRRPRDVFTLMLAAWFLVWVGFTVVEFFTPLELRANLAVAPVFVCLGAYALGQLASRPRGGLALAVAGTVLIAWDGLRVALIAVGFHPG